MTSTSRSGLYREDSGLVDGLSYGDYVEQFKFLLFLKMADEHTRPPFNKPSTIPKGYDWPSLLDVDGDALEIHYRHLVAHARLALAAEEKRV